MIQVTPRFWSFKLVRVNVFGLFVHTDYLMHVLLFVALVLAVNFLRLRIKLRILLPLMLLVATVAEVIQLYIPQRTFNHWDLVSNIVGVIIGVAIVWVSREFVSVRLRR